MAFGLFTAVFGIVSEAQEIHAFHNVVVAALLLVLSAPPAIAAARAPDRAAGPLLHLAAVSVAGLITMVLGEDSVLEATGRHVQLAGATVADFREGKIRSFRTYFDDVSLIEQIVGV